MLSTENNFCTNKQLTNTENLILKLISSGLPRYKIGRKMLLNKNNYFYYIKQIQKKLNVNNIFEAIILTLQENNQYVDPDDLIKTLKKCEINIKICANISGL
jgi:DNA-binding CsgD family transcriptional regulator